MIRRFFLLAALVAAVSSVRADDTTDFLKADNWQSLPKLWKLEGNTITGKSEKEGQKFNTFLCSKQKYKDFELSFNVKLTGSDRANSGIQVRSAIVEKDKDKFIVAGPQCDMGQQFWGSLYGEKFGSDGTLPGGGHMMKSCDKDFVKDHVKVNEFNAYKLIVKGKKVTISVNNKTTVDEEFKIMPDEGIIAFQLHQGPAMEVVFKDITFKILK